MFVRVVIDETVQVARKGIETPGNRQEGLFVHSYVPFSSEMRLVVSLLEVLRHHLEMKRQAPRLTRSNHVVLHAWNAGDLISVTVNAPRRRPVQ